MKDFGISPAARVSGAPGSERLRYRWVICALLFFATILNYMDRQILGLLKPLLMTDLGWSESDFGDVVAAFSLCYALGYAGMGRLMDMVGARLGLLGAVAGWSLCACLHGAASGVGGFALARGGLGLMEGGNFPAAVSIVGRWFSPRERALATGLFNAGSNVGAILTPILLPFIVAWAGWRMSFVAVGGLGGVWIVLWCLFFREPPASGGMASPPVKTARISYRRLLAEPGARAFLAGMLIVNAVWWFYLNWMPGYLHARFGVDMKGAMLPLVVIYSIADLGSVGGGWLSGRLIRGGLPPVVARQWGLAAMALLVVPVAMVPLAPALWPAILLVSLAAAGHQGFSANLYTLVSDTIPADKVASVVGLGGFAGGAAGVLMSISVGRLLDATGGDYGWIFLAASLAYPVTVAAVMAVLRRTRRR